MGLVLTGSLLTSVNQALVNLKHITHRVIENRSDGLNQALLVFRPSS